MALWEFRNLNKHGNYRKRIIHTEGALSIPGSGFGPSVMANRFKYKYEHPIMPPMIWKHNGKTYLMPIWKEVVDGTTVNDIEWIKPIIKQVKPETDTWRFKSSSSDSEYIVRKTGNVYKCNCPGFWRSKDRECKHIKEVKNY
jgi:hypothetical protein